MKKYVAWISLLVLLVVSGTPLSAKADTAINPLLLDVMDKTGYEWYATEENRYLFVALAICDLCFNNSEIVDDSTRSIASQAVVNNQIYVARCGMTTLCYFFGDSRIITFAYTPSTNECTYAVSKSTYNDSITPAAFMRELMKRGFDGYYKVDSEVAYAVLQEICANVYGVTP